MGVPCEAVLCAVVSHVSFRQGRGCARGQIVIAGVSRDGIGLQGWLIHWHALHSTGLLDSRKPEGAPRTLSVLQLNAIRERRSSELRFCRKHAALLSEAFPIYLQSFMYN